MNNYTEILNFIAADVCAELYLAASKNPKIMAVNWCAFAILAIYREAHEIISDVPIPSLDECFAGMHEPPQLFTNSRWQQLRKWHITHWQLAQAEQWSREYKPYCLMTYLVLPNYTLCQ